MIAGSLSLGRIVDAQNVPFILVQPMGFFVFFLASLAEMNRTPFDLTEAESELAAGYLNDYSSMKFGLFFLAEFMAALAGAAVITTLFLSGWRGFEPIPSHIWVFPEDGRCPVPDHLIRFTWPRLRIDQMLAFAWKGLFELTLVNLVLAAILIAIWPEPTTNQLWNNGCDQLAGILCVRIRDQQGARRETAPYRKTRGRSALPCGDRRAQTASGGGGEMTGLNLLKALLVTMKNFVRVPFTVQYPDRQVGLLGMAKETGTSPLGLMRKNPGLAFRAMTMRATVPAKSPQHSRFRGNEFTWLETRCTGCASCAKYCPLGIIEIVTHPGGIDVQEGESYGIDVFDIDIGRCMFCGLCVEACPYDALHMGTSSNGASTHAPNWSFQWKS